MKSSHAFRFPSLLLNLLSLGWCGMLTMHTQASPPPGGLAPLNSPAGGFGIDGDLLARQPLASSGDWIPNATIPGTGQGVLSPSGVPLNPFSTFHFIDPYDSTSDFIFTGGSKWADNPNTWVWSTGKPSSKTDINNVLLHLASDDMGHIWAVISADRASTSGDSYIDFELLQRPLVRTNSGTFVSSGPHGGRTTNDLVLSLAFTGGGRVADFFAWRWQADGQGGFRYVDSTAALPAGRAFVALNTNTIGVPYSAFGGAQYQPNAFAEAAIDLTALLGGFDPCESFGFESIMVKTKASASYSAGIEDLIDPIAYKLRIGPAAEAGPDQVRCADGSVTAFPLQGSASSGLTSVASTRWSVVSGSATIDNPDALVTTARVSSSRATLRLEVRQANGCTDLDEIVLTAVEPPAVVISGPTSLCPNATAEFSAPVGMKSYQWSISGNASILDATNQAVVRVLSSTVCDESFELTLTVSSNVCTVTTLAEVLVEDTVPPVLTLPGNILLECPADTRTNATGAATAMDDCGAVTVSYTDSQTNFCGGSRAISRQWIASDSCGNSTSATQTITVRDTTPPTLSIPPNVTLECPADTRTSATGVATAQDNCGTPTVISSDAVTPGCGSSKIITRTWSATDECGNVAQAVQTITVRDTTAPMLWAPANITLECPSDTRTNVTGRAAGSDASGFNISYNDVVTEGACAGTKSIIRTWTAIDACGNATNRVQYIVVQDTTRPKITCPNLKVQCPGDVPLPYANLAAFLSAGGQASDGCSATLSFLLVGGGGVMGSCPGTVTRVYRVIDGCGNFAEGIQTITVDDTIAPVITCPGSVTVECGDSLDPSVLGSATATDNCSPKVEITHTDAQVPSDYSIKWYAADPDVKTGPYQPTYIKLAPINLECPEGARLSGRAIDPLRDAVAYSAPGGQLDALTSLGGEPMALGQIVPFEAVIEVSGGPGTERGTIEFTSSWSTHTTSNDRFGYDTNYMVYCAFVDFADPGTRDPNANAKVESFQSTLVNMGTIDEKIQGTFRISGLESGDRVVVEIWVALLSAMPAHVGGTIASDLVSARKASVPPEPISTGSQTVSIGNLSKIQPLLPALPQPPRRHCRPNHRPSPAQP